MVTALSGRHQVLAAIAAVGLVFVGAVACSSSGSAQPTASQGTSQRPSSSASSTQQSFARYPTAPALLAQCAISHDAASVRSSAEHYNASHPKGQQWLAGGRIELTAANDSGFTDWFQNGGGAAVIFGGKQLGAWQQWAADHDMLPAQVCGSTVPTAAARHLYDQIYASWPSMLTDNPW